MPSLFHPWAYQVIMCLDSELCVVDLHCLLSWHILGAWKFLLPWMWLGQMLMMYADGLSIPDKQTWRLGQSSWPQEIFCPVLRHRRNVSALFTFFTLLVSMYFVTRYCWCIVYVQLFFFVILCPCWSFPIDVRW